MVRHIVLWRMKKKALDRDASENTSLIKEKLESLKGRIPGLVSLEVGIDFSKTSESSDLVLNCVFSSREDLDRYMEHPEHQAIIPLIIKTTRELRFTDYEI